jgi:hypothetical protein
MTDEPQRLCIGCMHFGPGSVARTSPLTGERHVVIERGLRACLHPWNLSPVDGSPEQAAASLRESAELCGWKGRWHESGQHPDLAKMRAEVAVAAARRVAGWNPIPQAGAIVVFRP